MANRLKPSEPIGKGIRRILRRHIDRALSDLDQSADDEAIHGVRKRFKKVRSVLRLIRDEIGDKVYRRENYCFRDAARPLTELRDATVLVDALNKLREHFADEAQPDIFARARETLQANRRSVRKRLLEDENNLAEVTDALEGARARLSEWCGHVGRRVLRRGLKRAYKKCHEAFLTATADATPENRHEWRKQAKYFLHELDVVEKLWPAGTKEFSKAFNELGQLLGDDRDLGLLRQKIAGERGAFGGANSVDGLLRLIDRRSGQFQERAFLTGQRIYQNNPKKPKVRVRRAG